MNWLPTATTDSKVKGVSSSSARAATSDWNEALDAVDDILDGIELGYGVLGKLRSLVRPEPDAPTKPANYLAARNALIYELNRQGISRYGICLLLSPSIREVGAVLEGKAT